MLGVTARYHYAYALYLGRVFFNREEMEGWGRTIHKLA